MIRVKYNSDVSPTNPDEEWDVDGTEVEICFVYRFTPFDYARTNYELIKECSFHGYQEWWLTTREKIEHRSPYRQPPPRLLAINRRWMLRSRYQLG